jgi:hypothetical protein
MPKSLPRTYKCRMPNSPILIGIQRNPPKATRGDPIGDLISPQSTLIIWGNTGDQKHVLFGVWLECQWFTETKKKMMVRCSPKPALYLHQEDVGYSLVSFKRTAQQTDMNHCNGFMQKLGQLCWSTLVSSYDRVQPAPKKSRLFPNLVIPKQWIHNSIPLPHDGYPNPRLKVSLVVGCGVYLSSHDSKQRTGSGFAGMVHLLQGLSMLHGSIFHICGAMWV